MLTEIALNWLLGALAGSMLFFAATVAPTVFRTLSVEQGGAFLRRFFPRYYAWGLGVALLCVLAALIGGAGGLTQIACVAIAALFVYARQWLMPRINHARDRELEGDEAAGRQFQRLHLQSVVINASQLVLIVAATLYPALT